MKIGVVINKRKKLLPTSSVRKARDTNCNCRTNCFNGQGRKTTKP
jgi:hypothetical protein